MWYFVVWRSLCEVLDELCMIGFVEVADIEMAAGIKVRVFGVPLCVFGVG